MSATVGGMSVQIQNPDVIRLVQPLVAGDNTITDNAGFTPREVEVRNNANGAIITARVISESTNSFVLFVPVAVASARISVDV